MYRKPTNLKVIRNAKVYGIARTEQFDVLAQEWVVESNAFSQFMRKLIADGKIIVRGRNKSTKHKLTVSDEYRDELMSNSNLMSYLAKTKHERRNQIMTQLMDENKITWGIYKYAIPEFFIMNNQGLRRAFMVHVFQRYAGYYKRNAKSNNTPNINISPKAIPYADRFVKFDKENQTLTFPFISGECELKFNHLLKGDLIKEKTGCNFVTNQNAAIVKVEFEKNVYEALMILGLDFNATDSDFVVMSDGYKLAKNDFLKELVYKKNILNLFVNKDKMAPVKDRQFRSKKVLKNDDGSFKTIHDLDLPKVDKMIAKAAQEGIHIDKEFIPMTRQKQRNLVKRIHTQINRVCISIAQEIIDYTISKNGLLAIDNIKAGNQKSSFGYEHIQKELITLAENKGVPFYVVEPQYTSQRCTECGCITEANRKDTNNFKCVKCGHTTDAQVNGAKNVRYYAAKLYEAGVPLGKKPVRPTDDSGKAHVQLYNDVIQGIIDDGKSMIDVDFC